MPDAPSVLLVRGDPAVLCDPAVAVVGARAARELGVGPGDGLVSSPESVFDLAGVYPLRMRVVGVLAPAHGPDDLAIFAQMLLDGYLKSPRVNAEVLNYRPFYIIGEVKKPGSYAFVSGMTVVNAIALAGGYTYRARENKIYVTRATDPKNVKRPADHDTQILPGDVIEVPERYF